MPFAEGVPTVTVQLDKPRTLAFTLGAIRRLKEMGVMDVKVGEDGKPDLEALLETLPSRVWACMDEVGRQEITVEQVEDTIYPGNLLAIIGAISRMYGASNPEAADGAEATQDPTPAHRPQLAG